MPYLNVVQTGIHNYTPALTTYLDNEGIETLAMVYSDQGGEQVHYSSSKDGKMWEKRNDPEAKCNRPVLATMGGLVQELQGRGILVTVYSSSKGPQLYSHFNSGPDYKDWSEGKQVSLIDAHPLRGFNEVSCSCQQFWQGGCHV